MNASVNEFKDQVSKTPVAVDHAMKMTHSMFDSIEKPIEETYNKIKTKTVDTYDSSMQMVRRNPVKSLAIAIGVGALTGYLLKRR